MMAKPKLVEVAPVVPLSGRAAQTFTYQVPIDEAEPSLYSRVQVPFGKRSISGVVLEIHSRAKPYELKTISRVFPHQFTAEQVAFARWLATTHGGGLGFTLRLFFPPRQRQALTTEGDKKPQQRNKTWLQYTLTETMSRRMSFYQRVLPSLLRDGGQVFLVVPEKHLAATFAQELKQSLDVPVWEYTGETTAKKRAEVWSAVAEGNSGVVVGTQKGFYLPWQNLKLLVVEEEHFSTHKLWDAYPRLDNRVAAKALAKIHNCSLLMAGSLASVSSTWALANKAAVSLGTAYPTLSPRIISSDFDDKRRRLTVPKRGVNTIKAWLRAGERVLVLADRRQDGDAFIELMQGLTRKITIIKVTAAEGITTVRAKNHAELFVGTSAVLRELHDFQLDRVVWLRPERALSYPDFRSHERALTTLVRLRELLPSRRKVVLITRQPEMAKTALAGNVETLHKRLIQERKSLQYPPWQDMVQLTLAGQTKKTVKKLAELRATMEQQAKKDAVSLRVLGPYQSLDPRRKKKEQHLLLLGKLEELAELHHGAAGVTVDAHPERIL